MMTVQKFVYGEGSGRSLETGTVTVGSGTGDGSITFDGRIIEVVDVTLQNVATDIADNYTIKVQAIENAGGTTGALKLDAFELDVTAGTPSWANSTGTGITADLTYSVTVLTE